VKLSTRDLIFYCCPRHIKKYLLQTSKYLGFHKVPDRIDDLLLGDRNDEEAEAIDRDVTRSMLAAEAKCKSNIREPWSKDLHEVMNRLYVFKRALSQSLTGIDMTAAIAIRQSKLSTPVVLPETREGIQQAL